MNIIQFKRTLKKYSYSKPKVNYKFLNKIVLRVNNADIAITPKLSHDQYKLYYKIAFNLCLLLFIVACKPSAGGNSTNGDNSPTSNNTTPVNQVQDMRAHKLWSMSVTMTKIVRIIK